MGAATKTTSALTQFHLDEVGLMTEVGFEINPWLRTRMVMEKAAAKVAKAVMDNMMMTMVSSPPTSHPRLIATKGQPLTLSGARRRR